MHLKSRSYLISTAPKTLTGNPTSEAKTLRWMMCRARSRSSRSESGIVSSGRAIQAGCCEIIKREATRHLFWSENQGALKMHLVTSVLLTFLFVVEHGRLARVGVVESAAAAEAPPLAVVQRGLLLAHGEEQRRGPVFPALGRTRRRLRALRRPLRAVVLRQALGLPLLLLCRVFFHRRAGNRGGATGRLARKNVLPRHLRGLAFVPCGPLLFSPCRT
jgi:hypothetical protein